MAKIMTGTGILWAEADVHKRHRKVMLPGFGSHEAKSYFPIFLHHADQISMKWKDIIMTSADQSAVLDMPDWASRAMLDAIGEAAFDYSFGAMEDVDNELSKAYYNLLADTLGAVNRSKAALIMQNLWAYLPLSVLNYVTSNSKSPIFTHARATERVANRVAKELVDAKSEAHLQGKGAKDIMSLLVRANASEDPRTQLSNAELYAQMRTLMLAGHETTASTLSWALLELSKNQEVQRRLRAEIWEKEEEIGGRELRPADVDSMPYLNAVLKETLRFHPVSPLNHRMSGRDDVLPLSKPIMGTNGEEIHKLPIPKGMRLVLSIAAYNRNKDVFGEDADVFNPDRWLSGDLTSSVNVGVYSNLLTFAGGIRACIGFRFALVELQAFLAEVVGKFEFYPTPQSEKIRREPSGVMIPTITGESEKGAQLPLLVRVAAKDD
ncbi:hypothetical protein HGRIS_001678 [Hohenbuehelia grisea]